MGRSQGVFSVLLAATRMTGTPGVLWLIVMRVLQGVGGALLMGNSNAITSLISQPFPDGLVVAFGFAITACLVAAGASWLRGKKYVHLEDPPNR